MKTRHHNVVACSLKLLAVLLAIASFSSTLNPVFAQEPAAPAVSFADTKPETATLPPEGSILPPPHESGLEVWPYNFRRGDMEHVLSIGHGPESLSAPFDKGLWAGWLGARMVAMIEEPAAYARYAHESWQAVITAYGAFGSGNIHDPFISRARENYWSNASHIKSPDPDKQYKLREDFLNTLFKDVPFPLFACIPQVELLKDEKKQDELLKFAEGVFRIPYQSMPKSHREGYLDMLTHMKETVAKPDWYDRELAFYTACNQGKMPELFTRKNVEGNPDPFRKAIAIMFRRVYDKTLTAERMKVIVDRIQADLVSWNTGETRNVREHNPLPTEEERTSPNEDDVYRRLQERLKELEKRGK